MEIASVAKTAVSDAVFAHLVDEILSGSLAVDKAMPSERELTLAFAVNRHAVREALKRLQARLIRISYGGKTRVENWRETAGLDVLSALAADAARLCAANATGAQLAEIAAAAAAYPPAQTDEFIAELGTAAELSDRDAHIVLAERLAARDGEGAHRLADELLGRVVEIRSATDTFGQQ